jgi:hypothetical protein
MRIPNLVAPAALAVVLMAAPACAAPRGRVYVRVGPPAPVVERVVVAPGPGFVWVPGYYTWNGRAYAWRRGEWMHPPRPRAVWVAPHWRHERRGWFFVEGHWR